MKNMNLKKKNLLRLIYNKKNFKEYKTNIQSIFFKKIKN